MAKAGKPKTQPAALQSPRARTRAVRRVGLRSAGSRGGRCWRLVFVVPLAISNFTWLTGAGTAPLTYDQFDIVKVFFQRFFALSATRGVVVAHADQGWQAPKHAYRMADPGLPRLGAA